MNRIIFILIFFLCAFPSQGYAQNVTLKGVVTEKETNEPIGYALVATENGRNSVLTDSAGRYSLLLPSGRYKITASYLGTNPETHNVLLIRDSVINFQLESITLLDEIIITSQALNRNIVEAQMGVNRLASGEIRRLPSLLGEVDVIKAIQLLPGVQAAAEGSAGFSVRGGAPDQNLILLDNTTIYNASHLMGFFSVFNNDILKGIELYKGDLPLRHGGRLSSLLDVNSRTTMPERFQGTGGIGLISSRLMLEGPLGKKTTWMIAGRRSYADMFLVFAKDEDLRKTSLYFYDANAKITHRFSLNDMLELNGYYGRDLYGAGFGSFGYGNGAASLTWRHIFQRDLLMRTSLNFSDYSYELKSRVDGMNADWDSGIRDLMLRFDFDHSINRYWNLTYGVTSTFHRFNPGNVVMDGLSPIDIKGSNALEHAVYISNDQKLAEKFTLRYGFRWTIFQNMGRARVYSYDENYEATGYKDYTAGRIYNTYMAPEIRAGFVWLWSENSSLKGNYARNVQYLQLANNSSAGTPLDVWFPAGPNVKPQTVDMFSLGYFHNFRENMFETSVEAYYKDLKNVIDFKEHADLMLNGMLDGEIRTGTGKAYGIEFMVRKNSGKLNGFLNYTLSRSERTIPGINKGKTYLAPYDKTHAVNLSLNYDISPKWSASLIWIYATGNPTTYPAGGFIIDGEVFPIYSDRNADRFPDYHRLDVSLNYRPRQNSSKRWQGEWNLSVYNVYNRKNPWMINLRQEAGTGMPYAQMIYLFGILPSITYNFTF